MLRIENRSFLNIFTCYLTLFPRTGLMSCMNWWVDVELLSTQYRRWFQTLTDGFRWEMWTSNHLIGAVLDFIRTATFVLHEETCFFMVITIGDIAGELSLRISFSSVRGLLVASLSNHQQHGLGIIGLENKFPDAHVRVLPHLTVSIVRGTFTIERVTSHTNTPPRHSRRRIYCLARNLAQCRCLIIQYSNHTEVKQHF